MKHEVEILSSEIITNKELVDELYNRGNAPKILNQDIIDEITNESTVTYVKINRTIICHVCYLNKFDIIGDASVMSAENHHEKIGKYYALEKVIDKIAELKAFKYLTN